MFYKGGGEGWGVASEKKEGGKAGQKEGKKTWVKYCQHLIRKTAGERIYAAPFFADRKFIALFF